MTKPDDAPKASKSPAGKTRKVSAPAPPYVGPAAHTGGATNKPIDRIVIHGTTGENACVPGHARVIARYFRTTTRDASAHYVVDPAETVQVVYDSVVAFHAPPNTHSLGVELCDRVVGPLERWDDKNHRDMLERAAKLVAGLCLAYDVPARFVGPQGLRDGRRGVTTHAVVSEAFGQSSHWDPGLWPRAAFMRRVREIIAERAS